MKKITYFGLAATALLCACDPVEEGGSFDPVTVAQSTMDADSFIKFVQTDKEGNPAADGNHIQYSTSPATTVVIYTMKDNNENVLAKGPAGEFDLAPGRGSDPNQQLYIRTVNSDRSQVITSRTINVFVKQDLEPEIKLIASNAGKKTWEWDNIAEQCWGNGGYEGFVSGGASSINGNQWWGTDPTGIADQISGYGYEFVNDGEGAKMVFTEDGAFSKTSGGSGSYVIDVKTTSDLGGYGKTTMGRLTTTGDGILFNQRINAGDHADLPARINEFDIAYLSPGHLVLIAPSSFAATGGEGWMEGTFWRFVNHDDVEGLLTGNSSKEWTWDGANGCWGNAGYSGFATGGAGSITGGHWWGVSTAELADQIANASYPFADGEGATMTFNADGTMVKSTGGKSTWSFDLETKDLGGYNEGKTMGHLHVEGDGILFNQRINAGEHADLPARITDFDIAYISDENLVLIAPTSFKEKGGESWMEGTMWRFVPTAK